MTAVRLWMACAGLLGVLTGCASTDPVVPPTPLEPLAESQPAFERIWRAKLDSQGRFGGSAFIPAQADGVVYSSSADGEIAAFGLEGGTPIWRADLDRPLSSGISVDNQSLYVATREGSVLSLDREQGRQRWEAPLDREVLRAPLARVGQILVSTSSGELYALDVVDGAERWNFRYQAPDLTVRGAGYATHVPGGYFASLEDGRLVALDEQTGGLIWERFISTPRGRTAVQRIVDVDAPPVVIGLQVFVGSRRGDISAVDGRSGEQIWSQSIDSVAGLAGADSVLVASENDGSLYGFDTSSGERLWQSDALRGRRLSPPVWFADHVIVGDFEGYLHAIDPENGEVTGRVRVGDDAIRAPVVATRSGILVQSSTGELARFSVVDRAP